ncbi:MAG: hypothetical protein WD995_09045 [Gemmatimonadota bacterium]
MRSALVLGLGLALFVGANAAEAQSWRAQAAWVAGQVGGGVFGAEFRRPIGAPPPLPLPGVPGSGPVEASSRVWHLTGMLAAGLNAAAPTATGHRLEGLGYGHGGVLYRTGRTLPGYVGLIAAGYVPVGVIGPAVLLEAADVVALQAGALHGDGAWRGHVALNVSIRFLCDIVCE